MRRIPALVVGALLVLALGAQSGYAHAAYKDSDPGDGETVSSPPSRVTAEFTEQVVQDSDLQVFDPCGRRVDNRDSLVVHDRITVSMSGEARGVYLVRFNVVSAVDGHPTVGSFDFTSSGGTECRGHEPARRRGGASGGEGPGAEPGAGATGMTARSTTGSVSSGSRPNESRAGAGAEARGTRVRDRDVPRPRDDDARADAPAAASPSPGERDASIWSGIPLGWFAVGLVIAAIVGAAGGFVYAGIVGPRRI